MKQLKGTLLLLAAALIWGTAFVAQTSASDHIGALTFNGLRQLIGAIFLFGLLLVQYAFGNKKEDCRPLREALSLKSVFPGGIFCGIILCIASGFQQFGIGVYPATVASSGRAGFITALYVVIVSAAVIFKTKKAVPEVLIGGALSIGGMYLLCLSDGFSGIYLGDVLILICAFCFAGHILIIDHYSALDGIKLSCLQFITAGVLSMILAFIFETPDWRAMVDAAVPILYTGIFSSGIAFTLQIIGQKTAPPAVASIAMSMESVFAALAGWMILSEHMSGRELIGCGLVFAAVIISQLPAFKKKT